MKQTNPGHCIRRRAEALHQKFAHASRAVSEDRQTIEFDRAVQQIENLLQLLDQPASLFGSSIDEVAQGLERVVAGIGPHLERLDTIPTRAVGLDPWRSAHDSVDSLGFGPATPKRS